MATAGFVSTPAGADTSGMAEEHAPEGQVVRRTPLATFEPLERPDQHPVAVYLARLAPSGRRSQRSALETIARLVSGGRADIETLPWEQLRYQHTAAVRAALAQRYAPATANRHLSALRSVLRECRRLGLMSDADCTAACDVPAVRGHRPPSGRSLSAGELAALLEASADGTAGGARDAALLAVGYGCGLRRAELSGLEVADYRPDAGELVVRGKGNKTRIVWVTGGARDALEAWLDVRGHDPGPVFCPVSRTGKVTVRAMTGQAVLAALRRRAARAGVARFSPHDLRRTFVGDLLDAGVDIATAQALAGHANVSTTARYDRRQESVRRQAAGKLHVPYTGAAP